MGKKCLIEMNIKDNIKYEIDVDYRTKDNARFVSL